MFGLKCLGLFALVVGVGAVTSPNPVRRVLSMLQMMLKKVQEEGGNEQVLFDKYMCYCEESQTTVRRSTAEAGEKIPQLQSEIEANTAEKAQLTSDIAQAQKDRDAAQKSFDEANSIRSKEAAAFTAETNSNKANEGALAAALTALKASAGASFLQTANAAVLRKLAVSTDLPEWDRHTLTAFLMTESGQSDQDDYEPNTAEVIGIISQMKETLGKEIAQARADEDKAISDHNSLVLAKTKEIEALNNDIQSKTGRLGEVGIELVELAQNLADTSKLLRQDKKFLGDLEKGCNEKQEEWHEREKTRSQEMAAISDTIQLLNDDHTTNMMKETFPSAAAASFLQLPESSADIVHEVRQVLLPADQKSKDPRMTLISMAMRGKKVNFVKVIGLMDKMVELLNKEQDDDTSEKAYCKKEIEQAEDEKKTLEETASDITTNVANSQQMLTAIGEEITKIASSIAALDKSVASATAQRKAQHTAFVEELGSNNAAIQILNVASTRLKQFYAPALVQKTPKVSEVAHSKVVAVAAVQENLAMEAFSFLQASSDQAKAAQTPTDKAPQTWAADKSAKGASNSIFALLDSLIVDIKKDVAQMEKEEKDAQMEYENFMSDSSEKHMAESKAISAKESAKAEAEVSLQKRNKHLKSTDAQTEAKTEYLQSLHTKCDWLMANFKVRQDARSSEITALKQGKAVISGADDAQKEDSFLQLQSSVKRNLRRR